MICKTYHPCQMVSMPKPLEPLKSTELPPGLSQHISADLVTPALPSGDHLHIVVYYYSRYIKMEVLRSTTADKIIASLKKIFVNHGLTVSITTDNGPEFISEDFGKFVEEECIEHRRVTPRLASGEWRGRETEPFLTKQNQDCTSREEEIERRNCILSAIYRTTPHNTTGVSPAELLFHRKLRARIPGIKEFTADGEEVHNRDNEAKEKGMLYAEEKRHARESDVKEGDMVLLSQECKNKLTPTFSPEPYFYWTRLATVH